MSLLSRLTHSKGQGSQVNQKTSRLHHPCHRGRCQRCLHDPSSGCRNRHYRTGRSAGGPFLRLQYRSFQISKQIIVCSRTLVPPSPGKIDPLFFLQELNSLSCVFLFNFSEWVFSTITLGRFIKRRLEYGFHSYSYCGTCHVRPRPPCRGPDAASRAVQKWTRQYLFQPSYLHSLVWDSCSSFFYCFLLRQTFTLCRYNVPKR
eukprot:Lithocolla_globosa_v1_NODE_623_length_3575_cov_14.811080.p2 type:complete len:203 gc:universal NODE_623_length_3575_cov_14.811080:2345-2953(+)